ncbi:hypothetical protein DEU38_111138 [Rhodococcus sp. AG1013]|uniref:hypothetical protein n=1 Tax=Rhodococcus sp. AG1013 TaxID=2183996 RepID=UPI000E2B0523|nr:hypothetical protein [Rhodococcus sp. AG1013]RDI24061.1 hypothetical protein DEU38_111138 [Rhodococcus sp. AG1013]
MTVVEERPLLPSLENDPAMALQLRKSLQTLSDATPDQAFKTMVTEVLAGRISLRDVVDSTTFSGVVNPLVVGSLTELSQLSAEEKEALAAQGQRRIEEEYAASIAAAPADGDDEYFDDRPPILGTDW